MATKKSLITGTVALGGAEMVATVQWLFPTIPDSAAVFVSGVVFYVGHLLFNALNAYLVKKYGALYETE